jgi:WD40 repeat protein
VSTAEPLVSPAAENGLVDADNPWPGLAAFREADQAFFHGREAETEGLYRCVLRERLTVLFGLAGLGKTSLLNAGLFPRLREHNVLPVYIRLDHCPGAPPLTTQVKLAIADTAAVADIEAPAIAEGETLWEHFHRQDAGFWTPRNRPVTPLLVFDQFEEAFTLGRRDAARTAATAAFLTELADLIEGRPPDAVKELCDTEAGEAHRYTFHHHPYKVLLSFREDFLPDLECLRRSMPSIVHNRFRILPLNGEQGRRVVSESGGTLVWDDVAEQVIRFVAGADDAGEVSFESLQVEPTLLSVVCRELNESRRQRGEAQITLGLLRVSRDEILRDFYERSMADIAPEVRALVEDWLVTGNGFRNSVAVDDALARPGVTAADLDRLVARHLLRREYRCRVARIELMHDVLTGVIRASRDARHQQEAQAATEAARREDEERQRSQEHAARRQRELRRLRFTVAVTGGLLLATAAATWRAQEARRETQLALADLEAKEAGRLVEAGRAPEALGHLSHAVRLEPGNVAARGALLALLLQRSWWLPKNVVSLEKGRVLDWSSDGQRVVTASDHGTAYVSDAETGLPVGQPMDNGGSWIFAGGWSPDGEHVVTGSVDGMARVWAWRTGTAVGQPLRHDGPVHAAQFSPDGRQVLTASDDGMARVWDVRTSRVVGPPLRHEGPVNTVQWSRDGRRVLTASDDKAARIWDPRTGHAAGKPMLHKGSVNSAQWSPDGRRILTASDDGTARIWDPSTGQAVGTPMRHKGSVSSAQWSPDGRRVVTVSSDTARVWDVATGQPIGEPISRSGRIYLAKLSADGQGVLTAAWDWTLVAWDAPTRPATGIPLHHPGPVRSAGFSADGERVLTTSDDGTSRVWDSRAGRAIADLPGRYGSVDAPQWSPDGQRAVKPSGDEVKLWDVRTGKDVGPRLRHTGAVRSAQWSPDGRRIVTASDDWTARVWDVGSGQAIGEPMRHDGPVRFAQFSPDGQRVVTASDDRTARVWDARSGQAISEPLPHEAPVRSARFSPDGQRIVTASADRTARVWDTPTGTAPETEMAVRWGQAVGGYIDNPQEAAEALTAAQSIKDLARLRGTSPSPGEPDASVPSLLSWFFADAASRSISPLSKP